VTPLDDLRRRLAGDPNNLELRIALAGALLAAGRLPESIELYRSVAIAYRDQGLMPQAVAVCHAVLDIAPSDALSLGMLAALGEQRSGVYDRTPLPAPLPYHVADPTRQIRRQSEPGLLGEAGKPTTPDMAAQVPPDELTPITTPHGMHALVDLDDVVTPYVREDDLRDELADRELPDMTNPNMPVTSMSQRLIAGALFSTIPPEHRAGIYARFRSRSVRSGVTVIRQGEVDHPLIVVGVGELAVRVQRGHEVVMLYEVHEGEHVGEGSLLARKPSPAHVVAVSDCELVTLPPKELYEIAGAFPALWARLKDIAEKRERAFRQLLG
jgi:hypothetical protein